MTVIKKETDEEFKTNILEQDGPGEGWEILEGIQS